MFPEQKKHKSAQKMLFTCASSRPSGCFYAPTTGHCSPGDWMGVYWFYGGPLLTSLGILLFVHSGVDRSRNWIWYISPKLRPRSLIKKDGKNQLGDMLYQIIAHIISYHIISGHVMSSHIIAHIMSCHIRSYHIILSCHVMSCHIRSFHIISHHIISYCHVMSCHVISDHFISYHIISYHIVMSCHVMSCHIISFHIMSYHIVMSCHSMSYHTVDGQNPVPALGGITWTD